MFKEYLNKCVSYVLGVLIALGLYASPAHAVATFVLDTAPAITDITAAGIAILAVYIVLFAFRRVKGMSQ